MPVNLLAICPAFPKANDGSVPLPLVKALRTSRIPPIALGAASLADDNICRIDGV
jgi:hypothetical protein